MYIVIDIEHIPYHFDYSNCHQLYIYIYFSQSFYFQQIFEKSVHTCLRSASENKFDSIAFPSLGSGSLRFPLDKAMKTMVNCLGEHDQSFPNSLLKDIAIVIYEGSKDRDTINEVKDDMQIQGAKRKNAWPHIYCIIQTYIPTYYVYMYKYIYKTRGLKVALQYNVPLLLIPLLE